jgi:cell division protein FtsZ
MQNAMLGISNIRTNVDTLIVIPNDKLLQIVDRRTTMPDALKKADEVLQQAVQGITDLINVPAVINLDFADVSTVMKDKGIAHIGIGSGKGDDKATDAVKMAVESPLLETKVNGATDVIINISGDITLTDASDASEYVRQLAGDDVNVIFGAMYDESKTDTCTVTVIATGIEDKVNTAPKAAATPTPATAPTPSVVSAAGQIHQVVVPSAPEITVQAQEPNITTIGVASADKPATSSATRPLGGINRPNVTASVEPRSLKIPDFLQRK